MKPFVAFVFLALLAGCADRPAARGEPAPDLSFTDIDGVEHRLSDMRGKAVLLELFGVDCSSCRATMRILVPLHDEVANRSDVVFWSIDVGSAIGSLGATAETEVRAFREQYGANWTFAFDADGRPTTERYPVHATPTLYLISKDGTIVSQEGGYPNASRLRADLLQAAEAA